MEFSKHIGTISMRQSSLYFRGYILVVISNMFIYVPTNCFYLSKQYRPSASSPIAKVPDGQYPELKKLQKVTSEASLDDCVTSCSYSRFI